MFFNTSLTIIAAVIHGFQGLISSTAGILSPALVNHLTDKNKVRFHSLP